MNNKFIPFGRPQIGGEEIQAVTEVLKSGWIGMGPKCIEFEKLFAEYVGAKYAVSVSSCTAALHLALLASGIRPGDEVITTPLTFVATINAIEYVGAKPVLVDINPTTLNLEPALLEEAITEKTKAILPVHFGGLPCKMDYIFAVVQKYGFSVIEDAAHALGAIWNGKKIGGLKNSVACFSFYPNKNITSIEGGMITTDSEELAEKIKVMRLHGLSNDAWKRYKEGGKFDFADMVLPGFKYNLTDVQAAVGICQLKKSEQFLKRRQKYAEIYDNIFLNLPCDLQFRFSDTESGRYRHALHLYVLILKLEHLSASRDEIVQLIRDEGIGATVHYKPVHLHPYYQEKFGYKRGMFPVSESIFERTLTLPLSNSMSWEDAWRVGETVANILSHQTIK